MVPSTNQNLLHQAPKFRKLTQAPFRHRLTKRVHFSLKQKRSYTKSTFSWPTSRLKKLRNKSWVEWITSLPSLTLRQMISMWQECMWISRSKQVSRKFQRMESVLRQRLKKVK
jgi:hypothetical protein